MDKSQPIFLKNLAHRFASFSFNELEKLLDESSGDESQKRSLMRKLYMIYTWATKIFLATVFDSKYPNSKELFLYLHNNSFYEQYLSKFADEMFHLRYYIQSNLAAMYDIRGAIDLLLDDCNCRLPKCIFPKPPAFNKDPRPYFKFLNSILKSKLLTTRVPPHFKVRFNRGRVILLSPNKYKLFLSIQKQDGPFVASKINFLLPNFVNMSVNGKFSYPIENMFNRGVDLRNKFVIWDHTNVSIIHAINQIILKSKDSLYEVDSFILRVINIFEYQRLYFEAQRLANAPGIFIPLETRRSYFTFRFWQSALVIALTPTGIPIMYEGNNVGEASGLTFSQVVGICKRKYALSRLHLLQNSIEGEMVNETGKVPYLKKALCKIIVEPINGLYSVVDRPELDPLLARPSMHKEFIKLVTDEHSREIALNHVKGDSYL